MTGCSNFFKIELLWPEQITTSNWFPPLVYTIFNGLLAIIFVVGEFYFIYLTHWALLVQTIAMVMLFISTAWGYAKLPNGPSQGQAPLFVRYTVAFWYWTLVNPVWDPAPVELSGLWAHLLNWLCLLISLFASRIPWSFKNFIWGLQLVLKGN
eukprot:s5152_g2.t1